MECLKICAATTGIKMEDHSAVCRTFCLSATAQCIYLVWRGRMKAFINALLVISTDTQCQHLLSSELLWLISRLRRASWSPLQKVSRLWLTVNRQQDAFLRLTTHGSLSWMIEEFRFRWTVADKSTKMVTTVIPQMKIFNFVTFNRLPTTVTYLSSDHSVRKSNPFYFLLTSWKINEF